MPGCQVTRWDDALYVEMLHKQIRAVMKGELIPCRCGCAYRLTDINRIFRCFFCGEYFCKWCAPAHFGRTGEVFEDREGI